MFTLVWLPLIFILRWIKQEAYWLFSSFLYSHNSQLFIVTYFVQLAVTVSFWCWSKSYFNLIDNNPIQKCDKISMFLFFLQEENKKTGYSLLNNSCDGNISIGYYPGLYSTLRDENWANRDLFKNLFKCYKCLIILN